MGAPAEGGPPILRVERLQRSFGGVHALRDVSLELEEGSLTALIGPNGAGKTTLFNLVCGELRPTAGRILFQGRDLVGLDRTEILARGVARAFQVASVFPSLTVEEALQAAVMARAGRTPGIGRRFPRPAWRERADEVVEALGLEGVRRVPAARLSHGDQKLLDLALALALRPRLLLLDEPTAGMGPEERYAVVERIEREWRRERMTVLFIEHDMEIVFRVARSVRVLSQGALLAEGTPDEIRRHPGVVEAYLGPGRGARA